MKMMLRFSVGLNLLLLGALVLILVDRPGRKVVPVPLVTETKLSARMAANPALPTPAATPSPFRWSQLDPGNDYRSFIANLRAIDCPESTIEDIVSGNVGRAFAWKRSQLRIDASGTGPWSRVSEMALVASLLGKPSLAVGMASNQDANVQPSPSANNAPAASSPAGQAYPLFLADANWSQMGFTPNQQAAIAQARQQFLGEVNGPNGLNGSNPGSSASSSPNNSAPSSNPNDPAFVQQWQTALQDANDTLQASLGVQGFATYEMQEYYEWFKPQVLANTSGGNLNVNLADYVPQ